MCEINGKEIEMAHWFKIHWLLVLVNGAQQADMSLHQTISKCAVGCRFYKLFLEHLSSEK